eukprot:364954-Chlamydomonas_euryale.AAC.3
MEGNGSSEEADEETGGGAGSNAAAPQRAKDQQRRCYSRHRISRSATIAGTHIAAYAHTMA